MCLFIHLVSKKVPKVCNELDRRLQSAGHYESLYVHVCIFYIYLHFIIHSF